MSFSDRRSRRPSRAAALAWVRDVDAHCDRARALSRDPLQFPRRYAHRHDRELVAMIAALLAFGRVETIVAKLDLLLARLGESPARFVTTASRRDLVRLLADFRHRTFRGEDIARLLHAAGTLITRDGGLYVSLEREWTTHLSLRAALAQWTHMLRSLAWPTIVPRSARHLLPDPTGPSACKRLVLLCRWIARPNDGVDLGLCALPTHALLVPLDVHVHRRARALGFTRRASASWAAAEEVTDALRGIDAHDPVRYDFALCHGEIAAVRGTATPPRAER